MCGMITMVASKKNWKNIALYSIIIAVCEEKKRTKCKKTNGVKIG